MRSKQLENVRKEGQSDGRENHRREKVLRDYGRDTYRHGIQIRQKRYAAVRENRTAHFLQNVGRATVYQVENNTHIEGML